MYLVYNPDGIVLSVDIVLLVRTYCSRTIENGSMFGRQDVRPAHWH